MAFQVKDTQLNATETQRNSSDIYLDDAVEIYIDTKDAKDATMQPYDYQFLVNILNTKGSLRGTGSGKNFFNASWKSAFVLQGTVNNNNNVDTGYTAEIAIPWAQMGVTPKSGMLVAMDLTNDDRDASTFDYFDWAGIAPNSYAQPKLWKVVQLQ